MKVIPRRHIVSNLLFVVGVSVASFVHAQLSTAVLPTSRSTQVGGTITAFATIINAGSTTATGCRIELTGVSATLSYQTTNPATNEVTGTPDTPVDIAAAQQQTFVIALTPTGVIPATDVQFAFVCDNVSAAAIIPGVNTLLLSASNTPVPDVIALAATASNDGIVHLESNAGAFSVSSINIGSASDITVTTDSAATSLPMTVSVCQTNPLTALCTSSLGSTVATSIAMNETPTFSVFVSGTDNIPLDPAQNRIFVRFMDAAGNTRGATSVAVQTDSLAPSQAARAARRAVNKALEVIFGDSASANLRARARRPEPVSVTLQCNPGQVSFSGVADAEVTPFTINGTVGFSNCETANGNLRLDSSGTVGSRRITISITLNGTLSAEGCPSLVFSGFRADTTTTRIGIVNSPIIATGTVSGNCDGTNFSCTVNNVDVADEDAFARGCR